MDSMIVFHDVTVAVSVTVTVAKKMIVPTKKNLVFEVVQ